MLLTGFDAPRLKKLYLGRVIKSHNLLQTLTRVNRTYKSFRYGYIVDFADIQNEFDKTNKAYFDELQSELGDEMEHYSNLFLSPAEIHTQIEEIQDALFHYDLRNPENFSIQVSQIKDREQMLEITRALNKVKNLHNVIRSQGHYDLLEKLDFANLIIMARLANARLALINTKEAIENDLDNTSLINVALEDVIFEFTKIGQEEMVIADKLKNTLRKTREMLAGTMDPHDPEFISLKEELERLFKNKHLSEVTAQHMKDNIDALEYIYLRAKEMERVNNLYRAKYSDDAKYARLHKRLMEQKKLTQKERTLIPILTTLKKEVDSHILQNSQMLDNEAYVKKMILSLIIQTFKGTDSIKADLETSKFINQLLVKEYLNERL